MARPWLVSAACVGLGALALFYAVGHFAMTTDTDKLISNTLPWRVQEKAYNALFPDDGQIIVVIDGKTPELAEQAAAGLTAHLQGEGPLFTLVKRPDATPFWRQNGLLFQSYPDVKSEMDQLITAQPFLGPLAADPSLRGLAGALSTFATGISTGNGSLADLATPAQRLSDALDQVEAGKPAFFSWRSLVSGGKAPDPHELRKIIQVDPRLDFGKLEPGSDASTDIRKAAKALGLDPAHGVRVRLTGAVPIEDEEFGTLAERVWLIGSLAFVAIMTMLWLAVRSWKTIVCILITTLVGLACAMAFGLLIFGRFNVISVAFIPLFVGLGIDFGIQFSVWFRTEQQTQPDNAERAARVRRRHGPVPDPGRGGDLGGFPGVRPHRLCRGLPAWDHRGPGADLRPGAEPVAVARPSAPDPARARRRPDRGGAVAAQAGRLHARPPQDW